MSSDSPADFFDREQLLRAAIATFEHALAAGQQPNPQEWLTRYPEVADKLAEHFSRQTHLAVPPGALVRQIESTSVSDAPPTAVEQFSFTCHQGVAPSLPDAPWHLPESKERRPDIGIGGALGRLLAVFLIIVAFKFFLGCLLGSTLVRLGQKPEQDWPQVVSQAIDFLIIMLLACIWLEGQAPRKMALRSIAGLHLLVVMLLVPLAILLSEEIGRWATLGLDQIFGKQQSAAITLIEPPGACCAYLKYFDTYFDLLARQPWLVMVIIGCLLPAVGEEILFRACLGRGLVARYGVVPGILCTSVLFGLVHIDPVQICYVTILGAMLHIVYLCAKTLIAPVFLHLLFNLCGLTLRRLALEEKFLPYATDGFAAISPFLFASTVVVLLAVLFLLFRTRVRWLTSEGEEWSPGYASAEIPPVAIQATPSRRRPQPALLSLVACAYLGLFAFCALSKPTWLDMNDYWLSVRQADALAKKGEFELALPCYDRAIRAMPDQAPTYLERGVAYHNLHKDKEALQDYTEAVRIDPSQALAYANRALLYVHMNEFHKAILDCDKAIELGDNQALTYVDRGIAHHNLGNLDQAIRDYTEALRRDPKLAIAYENRGIAHTAQGNHVQASEDQIKAQQLKK